MAKYVVITLLLSCYSCDILAGDCHEPDLVLQGYVHQLVHLSIHVHDLQRRFNTSTAPVNIYDHDYRFRINEVGQASSPDWFHHVYSPTYSQLQLYAVPQQAGLYCLQVTGLDRVSYSLSSLTLQLHVLHSAQTMDFGVRIKIVNLDLEDILSDQRRIENILDVFKKSMWVESAADLRIIYLDTAANHGARRPDTPTGKQGVVIDLASTSNHSENLLKLDWETEPLRRKLQTCPFKRTTQQREFRSANLLVDWCGFRLINPSVGVTINHQQDAKNHQFPTKNLLKRYDTEIWIIILFVLIPLLLIIIFLITIYSLFWKDEAQDKSIVSLFNTATHVYGWTKGVILISKNGEDELLNLKKDKRHSITAGATTRSSRASSVQRQADTLRALGNRREVGSKLHSNPDLTSLYSGNSRATSPNRESDKERRRVSRLSCTLDEDGKPLPPPFLPNLK